MVGRQYSEPIMPLPTSLHEPVNLPPAPADRSAEHRAGARSLVEVWRAGLAVGSLCRVCRRWQRSALCGPCLLQHAAPVARCSRCAIPVATGVAQCADCTRRPPPMRAAFAAVDYGYPWDALIARFKFRDAVELARPLSGLMTRGLAAAFDAGLPRPDLIVPAPLTPERLRERGYNQAWELTRRIARALDLPARHDLVERIIGGAHQATLHGDERRRQVRGAYALTAAGQAAVAARHIAIVDDVMTTGATLAELALTLQRGGAASVQAWVLARTPAD
jgi:ComF family protein